MGNWDHVAVSRAGVFMIETKSSTVPATVSDDALRFGRRVAYPAGSFRGAAVDLRDALHRWTGQPPWVTAVVVIWGFSSVGGCRRSRHLHPREPVGTGSPRNRRG